MKGVISFLVGFVGCWLGFSFIFFTLDYASLSISDRSGIVIFSFISGLIAYSISGKRFY